MSNNHIHAPGAACLAGAGEASPALTGAFAEVSQDADPGAVQPLFRPHAPGGTQQGSAGAGSQYAVVAQQADRDAVHALLEAGAPEPQLSGTGFTYRHNWGPRRGQWVLRLNWSAVNARSRVMVAIGEGAAGGPDAGKFVGSARYTLHNVAPRAGGVDIWVNIEWSADILLYVDYLVINP